MSLKGNLEQIEGPTGGRKSHSKKKYKKLRIKWMRSHKSDEVPNEKLRKGWEN